MVFDLYLINPSSFETKAYSSTVNNAVLCLILYIFRYFLRNTFSDSKETVKEELWLAAKVINGKSYLLKLRWGGLSF